MPLEHDHPVPLYIQLKETLRTQIENGHYAPHDRLPSERELAEQHSISRMTARQALLELTQEGLVYSRVGKGTFVSEPKIDQQLLELTGFSEDMRRRGLRATSRVLEASLGQASAKVTQILQLRTDAEVVTLTRIRLANGSPLAVETAYLPHHHCPGILDYDLSVLSLYDVLRNTYGYQLVQARQSIEATLAGQRELELLNLTPPSPILAMERVTFTEQGFPIEYVRSAYRGDRYKFRALLCPAAAQHTERRDPKLWKGGDLSQRS